MRWPLLAVLTACSSAAPTPAAPASESVDLELGEATWVGTMYDGDVQRGLRDAITLLRPCVASLAPGAAIEVRFEVDDAGAVTSASATPPEIAACVSAAAGSVRFGAPLAPFPPVSITAPYTVTALAGEPIPPERRCAADDECRLVTGGCDAPAAVHVVHARDVETRNDAQMSVASCGGGGQAFGGTPACEAGACTLRVAEDAAWDACASDADCAPLVPDDWMVCRYRACYRGWLSPP